MISAKPLSSFPFQKSAWLVLTKPISHNPPPWNYVSPVSVKSKVELIPLTSVTVALLCTERSTTRRVFWYFDPLIFHTSGMAFHGIPWHESVFKSQPRTSELQMKLQIKRCSFWEDPPGVIEAVLLQRLWRGVRLVIGSLVRVTSLAGSTGAV